MEEWEKFLTARLARVKYFIFFRRVVQNARAIGVKGKALEEQASEVLVKNWVRGMKIEGTINHV